MAIVVSYKKDGKKYILIGTGFGAYKATRPSFFGGNLFPHEDEGNIRVVAVADREGDIHWVDSDDLRVIEVDGNKIEDLL